MDGEARGGSAGSKRISESPQLDSSPLCLGSILGRKEDDSFERRSLESKSRD